MRDIILTIRTWIIRKIYFRPEGMVFVALRRYFRRKLAVALGFLKKIHKYQGNKKFFLQQLGSYNTSIIYLPPVFNGR